MKDVEPKNAKLTAFGSTRRAVNPPEKDILLNKIINCGASVACISKITDSTKPKPEDHSGRKFTDHRRFPCLLKSQWHSLYDADISSMATKES